MARLDVIEMFHGIPFPGHLHTQDSLQLALEFPFQDTDVLIVSYPKSGKDWRWNRHNADVISMYTLLTWWRDSMKVSSLMLCSPNRHHMDAANSNTRIKQRGPTCVPSCPKLGSGTLAGATLLCCGSRGVNHGISNHHHTPATSPAGPRPPELQNKGNPDTSSPVCTTASLCTQFRRVSVSSRRSFMWAEIPKTWWCLFTTFTKWPTSSPRLGRLQSFWTYSSREHVSQMIFKYMGMLASVMQLQVEFDQRNTSHLCVAVNYGSWFDHVKGWTSQLAAMNNLLHITYEEMSLVKENRYIMQNERLYTQLHTHVL